MSRGDKQESAAHHQGSPYKGVPTRKGRKRARRESGKSRKGQPQTGTCSFHGDDSQWVKTSTKMGVKRLEVSLSKLWETDWERTRDLSLSPCLSGCPLPQTSKVRTAQVMPGEKGLLEGSAIEGTEWQCYSDHRFNVRWCRH